MAISWDAKLHYIVTIDDVVACVRDRDAYCFVEPLSPIIAQQIDRDLRDAAQVPLMHGAAPPDAAGVRAVITLRTAAKAGAVMWGLDYRCDEIVGPSGDRYAVDCRTRKLILSTLPQKLRESALRVATCRCE